MKSLVRTLTLAAGIAMIGVIVATITPIIAMPAARVRVLTNDFMICLHLRRCFYASYSLSDIKKIYLTHYGCVLLNVEISLLDQQ